MSSSNLCNAMLTTLTILFSWRSTLETCNARAGNQWGQSEGFPAYAFPRTGRGPETIPTQQVDNSATFNVLDYGGKGDGQTDDTKLDGKIIAPTSSGSWGSGLLQWLVFSELKGIKVQGKGIIDGQGSVWWNDSPTYNLQSKALRFYGSNDVTVTGITLQNSPQTHLKFDDCTGVKVYSTSVSSPPDSPNTDGIHLQNSKDVLIYSTNLACGKDNTKACVSNITVRDVTMQNTLTGVRIKTWQGGSGLVQGVMFSNIQVSEVETPIMIDQYYCDKSKCRNESSAVAVSGINYANIKGTYTVKPVDFACSDSVPCTDISLDTIQLKAVQENENSNKPFCWEVYGDLRTATVPPIDCLESGKTSVAGTHKTQNSC
ncbi:Polygalacturonase [Tripterygium wilfordii]|uniref:Polygalacturonase n=1 Tax=Tripterygium wilfordii TaxID=458696 RepID=A0A7J7D234_TRIWF|nr:Polygalacturonase [Tripterygium wilfordii]